eukprot:9154809-Lingulodinium_polyedra.AAC.1
MVRTLSDETAISRATHLLPAPLGASGSACQRLVYCTLSAWLASLAPQILAAATATVCGRPCQASAEQSLAKRTS